MQTLIHRPITARILAAVAALFLATAIAPSGPAHAAAPEAEAVSPDGVVNLNTATVEQLRLLPRIGEEKANRIVAHREKTPFKTVNELARVRGIGLKTLRALKPWLAVSGTTTLKTKAVLKPRKTEDESRSRTRTGATPKGA